GTQVEGDAGRAGERLQGVGDVLGGQVAEVGGGELQVDDGVRAAGDVHRSFGQGLVHRHPGVAEAGDARTVAERLGQGGAQDQGRVLYGVVVVDVGVAAGLDLEVEQGVRRQGGEEVVEEPHPGVDGSLAGAVEVEGDLHGGLGGATVELGGAVHRSSRRICAAR